MNKKGEFSTVLGFLVIVLMVMTTLYFVQLWMGYGANEVQEVYSNYFVTSLDRDIATYNSVFEKTALFAGLIDTITHLGEHGGVPDSISSASVKDSNDQSPQFSNGIYLWNFVDDNNDNQKRIPFTYYEDINTFVGTTEIGVPLQNPNSANSPPVTAFVNIWMFKKGTVTVSCTGCTIKDGITEIDETGTHFFEISGTGTLTFKGSGENIAYIKTVATSPYIGTSDKYVFVNSINNYLASNLKEAQATREPDKTISASDINAVFGNELTHGFATGFAMPEEGITAKITGANLPEVESWSFGAINETLKARYWMLYYIVRDDVIKNEALYDAIETNFTDNIRKTTDKIKYWKDGCGIKTLPSCGTLLSRYGKDENGESIGTTAYFEQKMKNILEYEVTKLNQTLNAKYNAKEILFNITYTISTPNNWNDYWNAIEIAHDEDNTGICCQCNDDCSSCGKTSDKCTKTFGTSYGECDYSYGLIYTIIVTATDTKYKITTQAPQNITVLIASEWANIDKLQKNIFYADTRISAYKCSTPKPTNGCYKQTGLTPLEKTTRASFDIIDDCNGYIIGSAVSYQRKVCKDDCYSKCPYEDCTTTCSGDPETCDTTCVTRYKCSACSHTTENDYWQSC